MIRCAKSFIQILKSRFCLRNIQNHLDGVGGPENVTIALLVHGPALRGFHSGQAHPDLTRHVSKLSKAGVGFAACGTP